MNKTLKISVSVFFIVLAKVLLDVPLLIQFLINSHALDLTRIVGITAIGGFGLILIYNKLQRLFPFIAAVCFVFYFLLLQPILFYTHPILIKKDLLLYTVPGYIIIGNLFLFTLFKGLGLRISDENFSITERIINFAKHGGILLGGTFVAYFSLVQNHFDIGFYQGASLLSMLIGIASFINLILSSPGGNEIIENPQTVRVNNKMTSVARNPFFIVLIITAMASAFVFAMSFRLFSESISLTYGNYYTLIRLFSLYTVALSVIGIAYELFLRQKLILYLGIKNTLGMFPVLLSLLAAVFLINNHTTLFSQTQDLYFIFLIATAFLMLLTHFSFENITIPTNYTFYQPIQISIRHDFYVKSYLFGMLGGIVIGVVFFKALEIYYPNFSELDVLPYAIVALVIILFLLNSLPMYKQYRLKLQEYLDIQSKNIIINLGLFKDIENNDPNQFVGIRFVRYINLLYLSNPVLARRAIHKSINSENNLTQRVGLIKAGEICMLETDDELKAIKSSKYFPSSPNRDKIEALLLRFEEVSYRMESNSYVEQLSISKDDSERVFGAKLVYFKDSEQKASIVKRLLKDPYLPVVINAIISSQRINNELLIKEITDKLDSPALGNAAYSTLLSCGEIILPILEESFSATGQSEKVQLRIIQLYGDIANREATEYLLKKLNISNQSIISAALSSLSKCKLMLSEEKTTMLKHELEELCSILVWNMSLLIDIQKEKASEVLINAMKIEVDDNYDGIFNLLSLLYDNKSVKLIQSNLFSNDFEKINFALELASVLIKDELKMLIIPLFQPLKLEEKVSFMQDQIPTERLSLIDVLYTIIQRDSKWINQWTKACAMKELTKQGREEDLSILIANMINPDPMLAELAASSVFDIDKEIYFENKEIFGNEYNTLFDKTVLERIESSDTAKDNYPVMKFEIINNLHTVNEFSNVSGEILKRLTDYILPVKVKAGEVLEQIDNLDTQHYFYILYSGNISLYANNNFVKSFNEGSFISTLDLLADEMISFSLYSEKESVLYRISSYGFIELLTIFDLIPESIVKKTDNKKLMEYENFIKYRIQGIVHNKKSLKDLISYNQN